jgi:AraC-like DNA-binding protein
MRPLLQKLTPDQSTSFVARSYRTPHFEVPWHQHIELELILITEGKGTAFIGNYVGSFKTGDIFFLGANLPHTFQKAHRKLITSAVVVQFREDFWGNTFMELPESNSVRRLFSIATKGIRVNNSIKKDIAQKLTALQTAKDINRIVLLCQCLGIIAGAGKLETVSTQEAKALQPKQQERIDSIFKYTIKNFQQAISLSTVAALCNMSVPAFCNYFKKSTKKTYFDFLTEVRIGHACQLLMETGKTIMEVAFNSGFNNMAHFNRQFKRIKKITPSVFRNHFAAAAVEM